MRSVLGLFLFAGVSHASVQQPLTTPPFGALGTDEYQFDWPIQRVAIIGAGPSGLVAYRELTEAGLDVRIFERDSVPGGNWHYTEEVPLDAPVPNAPIPIGDFVPSLPPEDVCLPYSVEFEGNDEIWKDHRGPKPIWESLTTNMPSPVQQFPQWPWPSGTKWELPHYQVRNYVQSYASYLNINSNDENPATAYNTRVERVEKSLKPTRRNTYQGTWWTEDFDAVIVAAGRYNAPFMPTIPGLDEWVRMFPNLIRHSRQYRRPEAYANQTVLIVGASVSGSEISRDLNRHVRKVYQSSRPDNNKRKHVSLDNRVRPMPLNTTFVGEIKQFFPIPEGSAIQSGLIELKNGTIMSGIDSMILATGFRYSFPFLPQYYDGATYEPNVGSATTVSPFLPMDGSHIRDLYLDQFYLRDPTLAFIGSTVGTVLFQFVDYTTLVLAKVWTNTAKLPNSETMRALHEKTMEERGGYGKYCLFLGSERLPARIAYLIGWLNEAAVKYGGKQVNGLPKYCSEISRYWQIARYGVPRQVEGPEEDEAMLASLGIVPRIGADQGMYDDAPFYDDN